MKSDGDFVRSQNNEWPDRCSVWHEKSVADETKRLLRERASKPLILCGHGVSLRIEKGTLFIRDGLTHYPQERREYRYFKGDLDLPPRIILLDGSGSITFDVLDWLLAQKVSLARVSWDGNTVLAGGAAPDRKKLQWQMATKADPARRMGFAVDQVRRKVSASIKTLETCIPFSDERLDAVDAAKAVLEALKRLRPTKINELLGQEGNAARIYFKAWLGLLMYWKATRRYPIPDEWRYLPPRRSDLNFFSWNRRASHPFNAMLNYAYGVLETQVRIQAIAEGYDPTYGIMHSHTNGGPGFALDWMEPHRPVVDAAILRFVAQESFSGADFMLRDDGICRLNPQLARRVAKLAVDAFTQDRPARRYWRARRRGRAVQAAMS